MNLSEKVRRLRELRGYSQEYLAKKLKISQPSYARLEQGKTKLTTDRLEAIAEALEVKLEVVLNFQETLLDFETSPTATADSTQDLNRKTIELLEIEVGDLRRERDRLLSLIEKMVQ